MFEKNITKRTYSFIGTSFILLGIVFLALSVYIYTNPAADIDYEGLKTTSIDNCRTSGSKNGFMSEQVGNFLVFYTLGTQDLTTKIYASSVILQQCENMVVKSYCAGSSCTSNKFIRDEGGLIMRFEFEFNHKL